MAHYFETLGDLSRFATSNRIVVDPGVDIHSFAAVTQEGARYFEQQPSLRRVVGFIARQISSVNLNLYSWDDEGARSRLYPRNHAAARFLEFPAGQDPKVAITAMRLKESLLLDGLIYDRYCAQIEYDKDSLDPVRLIRLPASRVRFKGKAGVVDSVTYYREDGQEVDLDLETLFYDVGYTPHSGANGSSILKTIRELLDGNKDALEYRSNMLKQAARVPGTLESPNKLSDEAFSRLQKSWAEYKHGGAFEGQEPILEEGLKYTQHKPIGGDDVLDLDGRKLADEEVATLYMIYPELLGLREGTNSNMNAFRSMLWSICLGPYVEAWQQSWDRMVRAQFRTQSKYVAADLESKLMGSLAEESEVTSRAVGGPWMLRDEARARRNMPPIPGGDELITPLNVTEGGKASPMDGE